MLRDESMTAVNLVNDREKIARDYITRGGFSAMWHDALNAFAGRGELTNPLGVNVKINRMRPDLQTILSRDAKYLLGSEPYFPLEAKRTDQKMEAKVRENVINDLAIEAGFYSVGTNFLGAMRGLGTSYCEVRWRPGVNNIMQRGPIKDDVTGAIVGWQEEDTAQFDEGLQYISRGPYEFYPHPFGNSLAAKPWGTIKELAGVSEIKRLLDLGAFTLPDDVSEAELDLGPDFHGGEEWMNQWRRDQGILDEQASKGIGVFMRHFQRASREYPRGRWIYTWNYRTLLYDGEPLTDYWPLVCFRDVTDLGPYQFFGTSLWEQIRDAAELGDDFLSVYMNSILMDGTGWLLYDPDLVDRENLDAVLGNRIPIKPGGAGKLDQALREVPRQTANPRMFEIYQETQKVIDNREGIYAFQTGDQPRRKDTFGTNQILAQAGDAKLEFRTRLVELGSFQDLAMLTARVVDENITRSQLAQMLSDDEMAMAMRVDPRSIPGGFNWKFKGSSGVVQQAQRNESLQTWYNMTANDPAMQAPYIAKRKLALSTENFTEDEVERMYPDLQEQGVGPAAEQPPAPAESVGSSGGALMPPGQIPTPTTNAAIGGGM